MHRLLLYFLALTILSGCAASDDLYNRRSLMLDSESCRASAESNLAGTPPKDRTAQDHERLFDEGYRACMTSKGYDLPAEDPSAGL